MPGPAFVALALVLALLVLVPTRRLYLAGWRQDWLATYYLIVLGLAILVAEVRGPAKFLVPILVIAYLAPFVTAREGFARLLGTSRPSAPDPPKDVTPRDVTPHDDPDPTDGPHQPRPPGGHSAR